MIKFAVIAPHAPILLPETGSPADHLKVKKTLSALEKIGGDFGRLKIDEIIISSPHEDWGFNVPLYFIAGENFREKINPILTTAESPKAHFELGQRTSRKLRQKVNYALIASGDLSHCLKEDGPYDFNPQGPKFDQALIKYLKEKNIDKILELEEEFPEAGNCGLRSFAFTLGVLNGAKVKINPQILSYEGPFGVGYLVATLL